MEVIRTDRTFEDHGDWAAERPWSISTVPDTVIKIGGSLLRAGPPATLFSTLLELGVCHRLAIVPGGGAFADAVRTAARQHGLGPTTAHWMAVLAMDQSAHLVAEGLTTSSQRPRLFHDDGRDRGPERSRRSTNARLPPLEPRRWSQHEGPTSATLVMSVKEVAAALDLGRIPVIAPFAWLHAADSLPHSWDVTSDSIAAWVAGQLGARRLVLLKSIEGLLAEDGAVRTAVDRQELVGTDLVDAHFLAALPRAIECWILNGRRAQRLRELLECGQTTGTRLHQAGTWPHTQSHGGSAGRRPIASRRLAL